MSEVTMLTVKTDFDDSGLRKLETKVAASLDAMRKIIEQFNKSTELIVGTDVFVKGLRKIEQELKALRKECGRIELEPDLAGFEKALGNIETRLNGLERDYLLNLKVDTSQLQKAEALTASLGQKQAEGGESAQKSGNTLEELTKKHEYEKILNEQLYADKEEQEANFVETRKKYLESTLKLLEEAALDEIDKNDKAADEIIANIKKIKEELADLSAAETVANAMKQVSGPLKDLAGNLNAFYAQGIDSRIKSLEKSHQRELKEIEARLAAEMSMYDEQLEQYAELEKDKEKLTKEHTENMDELNSEMQDHLSEEEWLALQDRMEEETLRYEESMAALEADTVARDEILRQKELAEQEAMARKEQMEKEYAIRKAKLERKKVEGDKANSMFAAVINTAQGISLAWAQGGGLFGAALAALVAAAGAIQIATIAAKPLPEIPSYHSGGTIGADNIQHYRYLPGPDNPYDKTLFWGQKGEEVLNLHESEAYRALRAQGWSMADIMESRQAAASYSTGGAHIDNSKHVAQNLTIQARNELTFSEARRLARRQNRAMVRALA